MLERIFSWDTLFYSLIVLYVPSCIGLVTVVLLQKGKGAGFAGSFGAGAGPGADTVFGARAGQTLPVRLTYIAALLFVLLSLAMSLIAGRVGRGQAPELIEGAGGVTKTEVKTGLDDLGLGKGKQGAGTAASTATPAEAPAAAPAEAPKTAAPEQAPADAAPKAETPKTDAAAAPAEAPKAEAPAAPATPAPATPEKPAESAPKQP